ncbi:PREDICTED: uncharacterized protein LOC108563053 [Nicrophorus vespilloides]|uniref:Uncharacterized protein LOC108563053 n=1 Tax=Nicrophorus vespilloides TaxID=110193 RepID=A0ABM1MR99_NICVS|nr:PREDICTED: uncharacterized protein LOC108563053 [Nicrophorus vespilloides]
MSPKRLRQQNKTVTIYNSKSSNGNGKKVDKKQSCSYEQSRNNLDNWEFHFKAVELDEVKCILKCKELIGIPLIIGAAVLSKKEILLNLLKHGYNINEADKNNWTPLCWAVKLKQTEMVQFLLSNNADTSIKPSNGDGILFMALGNSMWTEDSFLLLWNSFKNLGQIDVNATNKNGLSIMHLAIRREWNVLLDILLSSNDINVNAVNPTGVTPLMLASYRNDFGIVSKLLVKGANVKRRNADGFTALCYAFSSAMLKNLEPPFSVIDKLQAEMMKSKFFFSDYLKDRLKIISSPAKKNHVDQPTVAQMLQHVFGFVAGKIESGFELLWEQLNIASLIKDALAKHLESGEKENLKLPLLVLNTIMKIYPFNELDYVVEGLIMCGCLDCCMDVVRRFGEDELMFLAFSPIAFCKITHENAADWLNSNREDIQIFCKAYINVLNNMQVSQGDFNLMLGRVEGLKRRTSKQHMLIDKYEKIKKNKRRKCLKVRKSEELKIEEEFVETDCVNAIKTAIGIVDEDKFPQPPSKSRSSLIKEHWKTVIQSLPFHQCHFISKDKNVDLAIKYLEGLLALIVNKYKVMWELDRPVEPDCDVLDFTLEVNLEMQQNVEKEKLRAVHREFYNLTRNVRQLYESDPDTSEVLLKELEKVLLSHSIRGETILSQVALMEMVKVNVTMPIDFENVLPKYVERVVNGEIEELEDVNISVIEHVGAPKNSNQNGMGDYVYLNDIPKPCGCLNRTDFYHYAVCDEDDGKVCCGRICSKDCEESELQDSRYCSLLRSLEMMEDSQSFFNGRIRISNAEKRKSHILSPSGNFAALEIGLGEDSLPLAVKFLSKSDVFAPLLKKLIDPIIELKHKNIMQYYLCAYESNFLVVATPLCEYNLGQYVLKMKQSQMKICRFNLIKQILSGLMYLHDHDEPIVHGNLKPSNVFITLNGTVRLAEFGIHKALSKVKNLPQSTIIWFASECYKLYKQNLPLECTCSSDIQVAGMLVHFAMNYGAHPFGKDVPDILKNLEKATAHILSKDMELYDLLTWMLLGEPGERPTIHQVLSHIFFWSNKKKWRYVLACAGIGSKIPVDVSKLHSSLDKTAHKENIVGNCWVLTAKKQYPQATFIEHNDTPSGLLKFIKFVVENNLILQDTAEKSLSCFILNSFPYFALSLYRMIENTEWSDHRVFMPFHSVVDY